MRFMKDLRIWLILAVFLSAAVILFGGQALTAKIRVDSPLQKALSSRAEVGKFEITSKPDGLNVELDLKQTANLQMLLEFIKEQVELYHKKPVAQFVIAGQSNPRLEELRYELSFDLEEAVSSGHYTRLKTALDRYQETGLVAKVYLSGQFIYLQLEEGEDYLYQAIPRPGARRMSDTLKTYGQEVIYRD